MSQYFRSSYVESHIWQSVCSYLPRYPMKFLKPSKYVTISELTLSKIGLAQFSRIDTIPSRKSGDWYTDSIKKSSIVQTLPKASIFCLRRKGTNIQQHRNCNYHLRFCLHIYTSVKVSVNHVPDPMYIYYKSLSLITGFLSRYDLLFYRHFGTVTRFMVTMTG